MKAPFLLTAIIVLAGLLWGVRESRHLSVIRGQHEKLVMEAQALGVPGDSSKPYHPSRQTKRQREDSDRRIGELADGLAEFARLTREYEKSGEPPDESNQRRIVELIDGMLSLNGAELEQLISGLQTRPDMDDEMRTNIIGFAIMMLAQSHPQTALAIFTGSSDLFDGNPMTSHVLSSSLTQWAKDQPLAAMEWIKNNAEKHPDLVKEEARLAVVAGAALTDFGLAFQLGSELGLNPDTTGTLKRMTESANTPERQREFLAALRKQAAGMPDKEAGGRLLDSGLQSLFSKVAESGYDRSMEWIGTAALTESEVLNLSRSLRYHETKADTGKWLDWMATRQPVGADHEGSTGSLVRQWTRNDYKAAGEWLAGSPAGPPKESATIAYLETVAPYDPEVAAQWARTLPGEKAAESIRKIHQTLADKDPDAAKAFAERYGLEIADP